MNLPCKFDYEIQFDLCNFTNWFCVYDRTNVVWPRGRPNIKQYGPAWHVHNREHLEDFCYFYLYFHYDDYTHQVFYLSLQIVHLPRLHWTCSCTLLVTNSHTIRGLVSRGFEFYYFFFLIWIFCTHLWCGQHTWWHSI